MFLIVDVAVYFTFSLMYSMVRAQDDIDMQEMSINRISSIFSFRSRNFPALAFPQHLRYKSVHVGTVSLINFYKIGYTKKAVMVQAWICGTLVALSVLVLALTVALVLALLRVFKKQDLLEENNAYLTPFEEKNTLDVRGVIVDSNNCRQQGVSVVASTWYDSLGNIWANISQSKASSWPPKGTVIVVFANRTAESHEFAINVECWGADRSVSRRIFEVNVSVPKGHRQEALPEDAECPYVDSIMFAFSPILAARLVEKNYEHADAPEMDYIPWRLVQFKKTRSMQHFARMSMFEKNPKLVVLCYDMRRMHLFVKQHFSEETLEAFCKLGCGALKRDLFRLCEIYIMGGIFADMHLTCLHPLNYLLSEVDLVVVRDSPFRDLSYVQNDFFAARASSPFLKEAIQDIVTRVLKEDMTRDALSIAGGGSVGRSLNRFAQRPESAAHVLGVSMYGNLRVRVLENDNDQWIEDSESGLKIIRSRGVTSRKSLCDIWKRGRAHVFLQRMYEDEYMRTTCSYRLGEKIPRVLLQTCASGVLDDLSCDEYMSAGKLNSMRQMRALHLSSGWGCYFATDAQRRMDVAEFNDARVLRAFDALNDGCTRAEFWAVLYLVAHGGVYYDIYKTRLHTKCFDLVLPPNELAVVTYRKGMGVTCHLWAAAARHPFFEAILREAVDLILERGDTNSRNWFTIAAACGEHGVFPLLTSDQEMFINVE